MRCTRSFVAAVDPMNVALFGIFILVTVLVLFVLCIYGIWLSRRPPSLSLYSRKPLRKATDLSYFAAEKLLRFLYDMHQYDNKIFSIKKAAFCRETGRVFPNAVTWYGQIDVDWTFLQKRYPGSYVSWGSLTEEQQEIIRTAHDSLAGFQTDFSSPYPSPKQLEAKYAFATPGPLYVDVRNKVLLGWKCVPDTDLEVLIVQKPKYIITLSLY
jgi:hypothetical protein